MVNGLRVALNKSNADRTEACPPTRGLNLNFNHRLKYVLKSAGLHAIHQEPFERYYDGLIAKGILPELARLTLARKIATVTLSLWNRGEGFDELKVSEQAV